MHHILYWKSLVFEECIWIRNGLITSGGVIGLE